jgi:TIR domain
MSGGVFISYRREDSAGIAGRITDRLRKRLGQRSVFFDYDDVPAAREWREVLATRVGACNALVAIIGKRWNPPSDRPGERRLDDPDDTLRIEIETALQRGIPVIPVLIDGAALPKREELPESLKRLLDWQSLDVDETRFDYDVERLYSALHPLVRRGSSIRGRPVLALAAVAAAVVATLIILSTLKLEMVPTQGPSQPNRKSGTTPVDSVRLQRIGPPLPGALLPTSQPAQIQFELTYIT